MRQLMAEYLRIKLLHLTMPFHNNGRLVWPSFPQPCANSEADYSSSDYQIIYTLVWWSVSISLKLLSQAEGGFHLECWIVSGCELRDFQSASRPGTER